MPWGNFTGMVPILDRVASEDFNENVTISQDYQTHRVTESVSD